MNQRENHTWDELEVGQSAEVKRLLTANDLYVFAHATGNLNPLHLPEREENGEGEAIAPSMWVGALVSAVLGNVLPGPGTLYRSQSFRFLDRAHVGDELTVRVSVTEKRPGNLALLSTQVSGRGGDLVAEGEAEVLAPTKKVSLPEGVLPEIVVQRHRHFDRLLDEAAKLEALRTAVVAPETEHALAGALEAAEAGLIEPILIGRRAAIEKAAKAARRSLDSIELIEAADSEQAAEAGVGLVRAGKADALMKGHLHTDELLHAVLSKTSGLRTRRRLSHAFVMDVPGLDHLLIVSDAAINIAPSLVDKQHITQNAIDLAQVLGLTNPKVGILSAVETVNPSIASTMDAAVLCKMAERGQITGGTLDGPLAMDNAVDLLAASTKGLDSKVAGRAEVLIVPNLEAGNILAKELSYLAHAEGAGIVLGASAPIILTSRADGEKARLASCAIAALYRDRSDRLPSRSMTA